MVADGNQQQLQPRPYIPVARPTSWYTTQLHCGVPVAACAAAASPYLQLLPHHVLIVLTPALLSVRLGVGDDLEPAVTVALHPRAVRGKLMGDLTVTVPLLLVGRVCGAVGKPEVAALADH
jgi:hypothetical protein